MHAYTVMLFQYIINQRYESPNPNPIATLCSFRNQFSVGMCESSLICNLVLWLSRIVRPYTGLWWQSGFACNSVTSTITVCTNDSDVAVNDIQWFKSINMSSLDRHTKACLRLDFINCMQTPCNDHTKAPMNVLEAGVEKSVLYCLWSKLLKGSVMFSPQCSINISYYLAWGLIKLLKIEWQLSHAVVVLCFLFARTQAECQSRKRFHLKNVSQS